MSSQHLAYGQTYVFKNIWDGFYNGLGYKGMIEGRLMLILNLSIHHFQSHWLQRNPSPNYLPLSRITLATWITPVISMNTHTHNIFLYINFFKSGTISLIFFMTFLELWIMSGEGGDRGWDGWMASLTQRTWVWANSGRQWRTEKPGVLQSMGSQRVRQDWATEQQ